MEIQTLQITKDNFYAILRGEQKVETRLVYPSNVSRYIHFEYDGKEYKTLDISKIPGDGPFNIVTRGYDALKLINGRRKDAPRLVVEVVDIDAYQLEDENGEPIFYDFNGDGTEYPAIKMEYHLGKILSTENIPAE